MKTINYGLVDYLTKLAQNPREWKNHYQDLTLMQVITAMTGKESDVVQYGEVASVYSGVHGKVGNLVRKAQARARICEEKPVKPRAKIVIIRHKNTGKVEAKRLIGGKWCNTSLVKF